MRGHEIVALLVQSKEYAEGMLGNGEHRWSCAGERAAFEVALGSLELRPYNNVDIGGVHQVGIEIVDHETGLTWHLDLSVVR